MGDKLPREKHEHAAGATLLRAQDTLHSAKFDLVILDEINVALSLGLVDKKGVLDMVKKTPERTDVILTGRGAPKEIISIADLATNFQEIKHPFQKGEKAKQGIEY